jgi:hypothetical protein
LLRLKDPIDKALFFNSTYITIGNGEDTPFWDARWIQGAAPRDIAPNLYQRAWFKNRSVSTELYKDNWIRNINNNTLLEEFVMLHAALSSHSLKS